MRAWAMRSSDHGGVAHNLEHESQLTRTIRNPPPIHQSSSRRDRSVIAAVGGEGKRKKEPTGSSSSHAKMARTKDDDGTRRLGDDTKQTRGYRRYCHADTLGLPHIRGLRVAARGDEPLRG
jgi:hypothetical protein